MKVLHLSTFDSGGGAARSTTRLHHQLVSNGVDSRMYVLSKRGADEYTTEYHASGGSLAQWRQRLRSKLISREFRRYRRTRPPGLEMFSDDRTQFGRTALAQMPDADVVNLHWVTRFIDYRGFFPHLSSDLPLVWRLSDMNPFSGGCHYAGGCDGYHDRCGACPQLGSTRQDDLSRKIWQRKGQALRTLQPDQLHVVAQSNWIGREARRSSLMGRFPVTVIPNGIDPQSFHPLDQVMARFAFGIPENAKVVLFVADAADNRRKGFSLLTQAFSSLIHDVPNVVLLSVGTGLTDVEVNIRHIHLGAIQSDRLLCLAYSAADLFLIPSLEDNLPNTVLESMACGTPVVGFDVGGIPDMIRPGISGELVPVGDVTSLRQAMTSLLLDPDRRQRLANGSRVLVEREYTLELQAERFLKLYGEVIARSNKH